MAKAKYKIDSVGLFNYLKGLNEGEGAWCGFGAFVKDNPKISEFMNEYFFVERSSDCYAYGPYCDTTADYLPLDITKAQFVAVFKENIEDAINNRSMYKNWNNNLI
ncbi:hypothetical protein Lw1_gp027 [Escherichia phage Lw1]|uniref:CDI immunity protein domain-containing protein n=1 Tax=Escherichia phage Lw1 TaxID=1307804 RepID=M9UXG2_9CAUD|nr:hypothetical protein Lw1_gp027 [Escherichia phage Lw1]AGJ71436.1 hypothetical protein Lw1_gp027 [Escherichia phage Lw1]